MGQHCVTSETLIKVHPFLCPLISPSILSIHSRTYMYICLFANLFFKLEMWVVSLVTTELPQDIIYIICFKGWKINYLFWVTWQLNKIGRISQPSLVCFQYSMHPINNTYLYTITWSNGCFVKSLTTTEITFTSYEQIQLYDDDNCKNCSFEYILFISNSRDLYSTNYNQTRVLIQEIY